MKISHIFPPLLFAYLLLSSCLQHQFQITVHKDGSVEYQYIISGDSADLYDQLTSLPQSSDWKIEKYTKIDTSEGKTDTVFYYQVSTTFKSGEILPASFASGRPEYASTYLEHPLTVRKQDLFFLSNYSFEFRFPSRRQKELYGDPWDFIPAECHLLDDCDTLDERTRKQLERKKEIGYIVWTADVLSDRFIRIWSIFGLQTENDSSESVKLVKAKENLNKFYLKYLNSLKSEPEISQQGIWDHTFVQGLSLLEKDMGIKPDSSLDQQLKSIGDALTKEFSVTEDLGDESFNIDLSLPGKLKSFHPDTTASDTAKAKFLHWEFSGQDFADSTIVLNASSTIYRYNLIYITIAILVVVVAIYLNKIKRTRSEQ